MNQQRRSGRIALRGGGGCRSAQPAARSPSTIRTTARTTPEGWARFEVLPGERYFFPLDLLPRRIDDDAGYFMLVVHDLAYRPSNNIGGLHKVGLYKEVTNNLLYGQFSVTDGVPSPSLSISVDQVKDKKTVSDGNQEICPDLSNSDILDAKCGKEAQPFLFLFEAQRQFHVK